MKAPEPPEVSLPVMHQRWSNMTFLHWRYPPSVVQSLVPPSLKVETFDSAAWVALAPFLMEDVRAPGLPALPWLSRFPETNVRTYVRDAQGRSGVWFLSLDAGRLPAVFAGRAGFGLPYYWSDMSVQVRGSRLRYRSRRHRDATARCEAEVRTGPPMTDQERDELAHFLTARYHLFTVVAGRLARAPVEHPPWPLHHAELTGLDQSLLQHAGLPAPAGPPILHGSPGVPVRIGMWRW
jgi:uncharacterized protein YqjF (DUF2071 family)